MAVQTYGQALDAGLAEEMRRDPRVFCMATNPPAELASEFGDARVRRAPIAESAMTGMAIGAAGSGFRPVVLLNCVTFSFVAFDQVVNQAARIHYMFGGQRSFPMVFRARYMNGTRSAAQHSQTGYAYYAHAGGLKIAVPSGVAEGKALFKAAVRDPNPVLFFESALLTETAADLPDAELELELGRAAIVRAGTDATIVAIGYMVGRALEAAERLAARGIDAEVIDPRTLVPLDIATIHASVRRTGRLVVVDESMPTCSMASEIVTAIVEDAESLAALRATPARVCTAPAPVPFSAELEDHVLPNADRIHDAVLALVDQRVSQPPSTSSVTPTT